MRVMGVDPGTVVLGYGIVDSDGDSVVTVHFGALKCSARLPLAKRLGQLYQGLLQVVSQYRPEVVAVEQPFVAENVRSALALGMAQAVAILAATNCDVPVYCYSPAQVKQRVANYGASSKEQIQEVVRLHLGLSEIPEPSDAADALAVAICHLGEVRFDGLLAQQEEKQ